MKNLAVAILITLLFTVQSGYSQSETASFGIRAGFDLQNFNGKDFNGDNVDHNLVPRFNVGLIAEIPMAPEFYVQTGLFYTTKGSKADGRFLGMELSAEANLAYLEVPINFLYKPQLGNGHLLLGFGPYLAYGIGGKASYTIDNTSSEDDIDFTDGYNSNNDFDRKYYKPFDYGVNFLFGYQLSSGVFVQMNTQLGLARINSENRGNTGDESNFKNTGFGLSLGYMF